MFVELEKEFYLYIDIWKNDISTLVICQMAKRINKISKH
jgi:hypothetical protein